MNLIYRIRIGIAPVVMILSILLPVQAQQLKLEQRAYLGASDLCEKSVKRAQYASLIGVECSELTRVGMRVLRRVKIPSGNLSTLQGQERFVRVASSVLTSDAEYMRQFSKVANLLKGYGGDPYKVLETIGCVSPSWEKN